MNNLNELLSREYWMQYLELATEGGLTDGAIANDIIAGIEKAINYSQCFKSDSEQLLAYTEFLRKELHLNISDTWVESYKQNSK